MKLLVQTQTNGALETIATREYDAAGFHVPEPRSVLTIPELDEGEETNFWIVQNVIHHLGEESAEIHLVVQDQEEMIREMREQRARMAQLQQLAGAAGGQAAPGGQGGQGGSSKLWTP